MVMKAFLLFLLLILGLNFAYAEKKKILSHIVIYLLASVIDAIQRFLIMNYLMRNMHIIKGFMMRNVIKTGITVNYLINRLCNNFVILYLYEKKSHCIIARTRNNESMLFKEFYG